MLTPYAIFNGRLIQEQNIKLSIHDLALTRGYGIFDFFKTVQNIPLFIDDNLNRFYQSAELMHLPIKYSKSEIKTLILQLIKENNIPESGIKILLTGGYSKDGYSIGEPNLIISQQSLVRNLKLEQSGISLLPFEYHRPLNQVKSIDYSMGIYALQKAHEQEADDVVYMKNGRLSECPRANFFLIDANYTLLTAPENYVLQGITRMKILALAKNNNLNIEIRDISIQDVAEAKEAFISSTTKNITPVHSIVGIKKFPKGAGEITKQLQASLEELMIETISMQ